MKPASAALTNTLKQANAIYAQPQLIAEWNQNRYAGIQTIDNTPTESTDGHDVEVFPIESIVDPNRPEYKGVVKARVGNSNTDSSWVVKDGFQTSPGSARYYDVSKDDIYKYWCSPVASSTSLGGGQYGFTKTVQPYVLYTNMCWTNKIWIVFESTWAKPNNYTVQITLDGSTWTTVATNPTIDSYGRVILYRQANGTWGTTVYRENPLKIKGLRLVVTAIDKNASYFNLIELSARVESDLTDFLISYSSTFTMSETSFVTPIGKASSNTASIRLSNIDRRFNTNNTDSLYAGIVDANVKFIMKMNYNTTQFGGTTDTVQMLSMFVEQWDGQDQDTVDVSLKDYSKFLQEVKPGKSFYTDITVGEIVWTLCDAVGFTGYVYTTAATNDSVMIPYFWTTGEETVWEVFARISEMTQTAIYFDENGFLQIKTRDAAYNTAAALAWELDATTVGSKLPDIITIGEGSTYEANSVKINYKTTKISDDNNGFPQMESIWEPEDTLVLRSTQLVESMTTSAVYMKINKDDVITWPFSGLVQLDGEFIRYEGKGYYYYDLAGVFKTIYVKSAEEQNHVDKDLSSPALRYKNTFSGHLLITKRGEFNTTNIIHTTDANGWYNRHCGEAVYPVIEWNAGFIHTPADSTVTLASTTSRFDSHNWYLSTRNYTSDDYADYFGTRVQFGLGGYTQGLAGLVFWNSNPNGNAEAGYFVELIRTSALGTSGRKFHNELNFYAVTGSGAVHRYGPNGGLGIPMAIEPHVWYDIDVIVHQTGTQHIVDIYINGIFAMSATMTGSQRITPTGRNGIFTRGNTRAAYEYFYAVRGVEDVNTTIDAGSFFDKVRGGWVSGQWEREWTYNWTTKHKLVGKTVVDYQQRSNNRFFDDFGPYVHEVREFNVEFEKSPVVHSQLYTSNDYQTFCPEYTADAFSAQFLLANTARVNAVLKGEDTLTFGADNSVDQQTFIYGRTVFQEDEKTITVRDEAGIRRRGLIELEISGDVLQTESAAKALGDWIVLHWGQGNDEVQVTIFGNPLIQIGDKVSINYPPQDMTKLTHQYFVVGIQNSFDEGFTTTLTLRRCRLT